VSFHEPGTERDPKNKGTASWSYEDYVAEGDEKLLGVFAPSMEDEDEEDDEPAALPKAKAKAKPKAKAKAKAKKPAKKPAKAKKK
jgi:hypothetical protein